MTTDVKSLANDAVEATVSGAKFQKNTRLFIDERISDGWDRSRIAHSLSNMLDLYRDTMEAWIHEDEDNVQMRRKVVNNVVNDVSRLSRQELGFTIKCVSRKPSYIYEATPWEAPVVGHDEVVGATEESAEGSLIAGLIVVNDKLKKELETLKNKFKLSPVEVIGMLCEHHTPEALGRMLLDKINNS